MHPSLNKAEAIALSKIKGVDANLVKQFTEAGISVEDFFRLSPGEIRRALNLKSIENIDFSSRQRILFEAQKEFEKLSDVAIEVLFILDTNYPVRLFQIPDPPVVLYKLGDADLDESHILSVVGTRRATAYGLNFASSLIEDLAQYFPTLTIVSGLALGLDTRAHTSAIENGLPTVAVVAHGLNMIYPAQNKPLAREILKKGGAIVTEYPFDEAPYRQRFLERNRIIAALADATLVVESDIKGGAMSTATTAFNYSREVLALPGRINDPSSAGCNLLIRKEKARLITNAADLIEATGWQPADLTIDTSKRNLFPEIDGKAKQIYDILRFNNQEPIQLDRLHHISLIPMAELLPLLSELEFDGIITRLPGNRYTLS